MQATLSKLVNLNQHEHESLASYGKRFIAQMEATEEVVGGDNTKTITRVYTKK